MVIMNWSEDGTARAGHLKFRVWDNVRSYWEVSCGAHVLGTGVSKDLAMAKFDASAHAYALLKVVEEELL